MHQQKHSFQVRTALPLQNTKNRAAANPSALLLLLLSYCCW
jgi:hypothetical protein